MTPCQVPHVLSSAHMFSAPVKFLLSFSKYPLLMFHSSQVWLSDTSVLSFLFLLSGLMCVFCFCVLVLENGKACVCLIRLVEHAGLMCVVSVFNQWAAHCMSDVDGELIKQYLWCLHQLQHFVLPLLLMAARQTTALSMLELKYFSTATSVFRPHPKGTPDLSPVKWDL